MPTGVYERKPCASGCVCGKHRPQNWTAERRANASAAQRRARTPDYRARVAEWMRGRVNYLVHGETARGLKTPEYMAWQNMRARCTNPRHPRYVDYGGRGITIAPRWDDYAAFLADVGRRPGPEYSMDRIDNDGNYEPGNVRWATRSEQQRNRRNSKAAA